MTIVRTLLANILALVLIWTMALSSYGLASQALAANSPTDIKTTVTTGGHSNSAHTSKVMEGHALHQEHQAHHNGRKSTQHEREHCFNVCVKAVSVFDVKEILSTIVPPEDKVFSLAWFDTSDVSLASKNQHETYKAQAPPNSMGEQGVERLLLLNARLRN